MCLSSCRYWFPFLLAIPIPAPRLKQGVVFVLALAVPAYGVLFLLPVMDNYRCRCHPGPNRRLLLEFLLQFQRWFAGVGSIFDHGPGFAYRGRF